MTQTSYPLINSPILNQKQWSNMAQHWLETGVIQGVYSDLAVAQDTSGMQVKVLPGQAWIQGHFYESDAAEILAIGASDPVNVRLDRIVLRLDWDAGTIQLSVLQGVPSATPSAPALTQNSSRWEISLATIRVEQGTGIILFTKITDERNLVKNANAIQEKWITPVFQNAWINYGNNYESAGYMKDEFGWVNLKGMIYNGLLTKAAFILPAGYRPIEIIPRATQAHDGTNIVHAGIEIKPTGNIDVMYGGNTWVKLNGIRFKAEQ
jgi:hypothetical protein